MAVSRTEAVREGMRGRGWTLLHSYGDLLWALGDKSAPNEGFTPTRIFPLAAHEGQGPAGDEDAAVAAAGAPAEGSDATAAAVAAEQLAGVQLGDEGGAGAGPSTCSEGSDSAAAAETGASAGPGGPGMDELLEAAVLAGVAGGPAARICIGRPQALCWAGRQPACAHRSVQAPPLPCHGSKRLMHSGGACCRPADAEER